MTPQCKSSRAPLSIGKTNAAPSRGCMPPIVLRLTRNPRSPVRLLCPLSALFNCLSPDNSNIGISCSTPGQGQFFMLNRIAENETVFERLQAAIFAGAI